MPSGGYDTRKCLLRFRCAVEKLDWDHIDTVLLDLDGTLLDLGFDNDFWLDFVPAAYAAARSLTLEEARAEL